MSIKKMFLLAGMALAAIAFAGPVAAQGAVTLTDASGNVLKKNAAVTATSKNLETTISENILTCEEVVLHYTVNTNANGGKHVVLDPVGLHNATVSTNCVVHVNGVGTFPAHITNAGAQQLTINTWGTATTAATFTLNVTPPINLHCSYTGNVSIQATNGTDLAHVETGSSLTAPQPGCKPDEPHGTFTLTSGGTPIIADITPTP